MVVPPPTERLLRRRAQAGGQCAAAPVSPLTPGPDRSSRDGTAADRPGPDEAGADGVGPDGLPSDGPPSDGPPSDGPPSEGPPTPVPGAGSRPRRVVPVALLVLVGLIAAGAAWGARGQGPATTEAAVEPGTTEASTGISLPPAPPSTVVPGSVVTVSASQSTVIVAGAVPSQAIAEELVGRAGAVYALDQVQNQLAVDPATRSPIVVVVNGATTDTALFNRLTAAFTGIVGIDTIELAGLRLNEPSELEAALMALPSVEFAPASADIDPGSLPVLDQMTALLAAAPDTAIEIGAHTDTRGSPDANRALSQARAAAVAAALTERGVANILAARGFGGSRPLVVPDDTALTQEVNRRIELRVL